MEKKKGLLHKIIKWMTIEDDVQDFQKYFDEPQITKPHKLKPPADMMAKKSGDHRLAPLKELKPIEPTLHLSQTPQKEDDPPFKGAVDLMPTQTGGIKSLLVCQPTDIQESKKIIQIICRKKPIVIKLDLLEPQWAQRLLDYLHGAADALGSNIQKIEKNIFVIAPVSTDVKNYFSQEGEAFAYKKDDNPKGEHA